MTSVSYTHLDVYKRQPKQHSIGKLAECLLFYDEVNIIFRPNSFAHLLQNIGINELDDLRAFGLKIYIATDYFAAMPIGSGTRIMLLQTPHTDMHYSCLLYTSFGKRDITFLTTMGN